MSPLELLIVHTLKPRHLRWDQRGQTQDPGPHCYQEVTQMTSPQKLELAPPIPPRHSSPWAVVGPRQEGLAGSSLITWPEGAGQLVLGAPTWCTRP